MAEILSLEWVSKMMDYGLVLFFLVSFFIFLKVNWKDTLASAGKSEGAPAGTGAAASFASSASRSDNNAEIMAAISAAVNEYRKTNK